MFNFLTPSKDTPSASNNPEKQQEQTASPEPQEPAAPKNPLDSFNGMFDNDGAEGERPAQPSFALDPEAVSKAASQIDFTKSIPPELSQRIADGDSTAMMQALNHVAQSAYSNALQHGGHLTDKFVSSREAYLQQHVLPEHTRQQMTSASLHDTPNYDHPVVAKQLNMVAGQLAKQHPGASPSEIARMAQDYIQELARAISPKSEPDEQPGHKDGEFDYTAFLKNA